MAGYKVVNLKEDVEDSTPKFGCRTAWRRASRSAS